jgi:DNA-binding response OmpR family regulator
MIDEHMPDLVVLDYKMKGMDGMAVMKTLRASETTRSLPVLMLTAMNDEPSTRAGFDAGVTDYVTKPFSIPQLTARVRACLARIQVPAARRLREAPRRDRGSGSITYALRDAPASALTAACSRRRQSVMAES